MLSTLLGVDASIHEDVSLTMVWDGNFFPSDGALASYVKSGHNAKNYSR
jgi:hypothetical protein